MTRRIFVDAEFTRCPWQGEFDLAWIGLADASGRVWYAISSELNYDPYSSELTDVLFRVIPRDEPRLTKAEMAAAIIDFCGDVDEFWAWIPTLESFKKWSGLGEEAAAILAKWRDFDLQMLQSLVKPWPDKWPDHLHDLHTGAIEAAISIPRRAKNHKHPRVHAEWNLDVFKRIQASRAS